MANTKHKPAKGKPISGHPLFPAVVALWFGALFGLGSLAIRPTLIEGVVLRSGIDLIVPAAAPPLGVTARILIALVMAALGAAIGAALAIRVARPKVVLRERKRTAANPGAAAEAEAALWNSRNVYTDGPVLRPLSADDDQDATIDSTGLLAGRRRALAVEQEERPFEPHDLAPLPGGEPQIFDISATQLAPGAEPDAVAGILATEALDLGAFPAPAPVEPQPQPAFQAPLPDATPAPLVEREVSASNTDLGHPTEPRAAPADLGMTDLARRLQESMARRRAARAKAAEPSEPATPAQEPDAVLPGAEPAFVPPPPIFDIAAREAAALPDIPPAPIAMPVALRPVTFDHHDDEDHGDLAELMPRHLAMPTPSVEASAEPVEDAVAEAIIADQPILAVEVEPETELEAELEAETQDAAEDAFASLLTIDQSRQQFVRIEEAHEPVATIEPVVIFPGQMASATVAPLRPLDPPAAALSGAPVAAIPNAPSVDPNEAERALRLALANLQRISGAA